MESIEVIAYVIILAGVSRLLILMAEDVEDIASKRLLLISVLAVFMASAWIFWVLLGGWGYI